MSIFGNPIQKTTTTYTTDQHPITVETFFPQTNGTRAHPAVIALHGSGGLREGWAEAPASLLAARGFAVFVVHYFERTGTVWADDRSARENFEKWMKTISDAVTFVGTQPGVDGQRVGLLGFSLGAYLALSVAVIDPRVRAVVDYFGGLPQELIERARQLPPVLVLHGEKDVVVPVSEARKLEQLFQQTGTSYEIKLYPGAGHGFFGLEMLDAGQRTLKFLERNLHG